MRLILPVLLLHAIRAQVHESCERDDCLKGEPEDAMMLQAFADRKDAKNFARDVLQVSKAECDSGTDFPEDSDGIESTPFKNSASGKSCGRTTLTVCGREAHGDYDPCWQDYENCIANNLANEYTVKFDLGDDIDQDEVITPPMNTCITGTCVKAGNTQECTVIATPVKRTESVMGSVTISASKDISDYRIQYACGTACDPPGTDTPPGPDTPPGGADGDPHIHTMKGDHYTLIKQGNFLAFSFKGKEALVAPPGHSDGASVPVDFELFAHYSNGRKSFTRGLLLLDHQNHQAMEMTSEDCRWRVRAGESDWKTLTEWRKSVSKSEVLPDLLYQRGNGAYVTGLNISRAEMTLNISKKELNRSLTRAEIQGFDGKTLRSYVKAAILINMNTPTGLSDVVKLTVKCFPGYHMNYNVNMSNAKDLSFVGGELGGSSGPKESQAFLQVGQGTIQMRSDSGFQYHQSWEELGGSASAALYLHQDDSVAEGFNLMTTPCTESDQQKATEICRKAGLKNEASLSFAECVFDVCRAGGDALPELTELSWLQDD